MTPLILDPSDSLELSEIVDARGNITKLALDNFKDRYDEFRDRDEETSDEETSNDSDQDIIRQYLYGVMHAPDWRETPVSDTPSVRHTPTPIPLVKDADFKKFCSSGKQLMDLHLGYKTAEELSEELSKELPDVICTVDGEKDEGKSDSEAYRIQDKISWGRGNGKSGPDGEDHTVLIISDRCRLVGIPVEAQNYKISGRSPLQRAIDSLQVKHHQGSGIIHNANEWHEWANEPYNLILYLKRLVAVSVMSWRVIAELPSALPSCLTKEAEPATPPSKPTNNRSNTSENKSDEYEPPPTVRRKSRKTKPNSNSGQRISRLATKTEGE